MSDIQVDRLIVLVEAQTASFQAQLRRLEGQMNQSASRMARSFEPFNAGLLATAENMKKAFTGFVGFEAIRGLITSLGDLKRDAEKAGTSVADLQRLSFAGAGTGAGI